MPENSEGAPDEKSALNTLTDTAFADSGVPKIRLPVDIHNVKAANKTFRNILHLLL